MKTSLLYLALAVALLCGACRNLDQTGAYKGDQTLYAADLTITTSYQLFDTFVTWEYSNRAALAAQPQIRVAADKVRAQAKAWIGSAIVLREAYAANPTADNKAALATSLSVLQAALNEATKYLATTGIQKPEASSP